MSGVPYHAWTHAPKAQGGTDPVPAPTLALPYPPRWPYVPIMSRSGNHRFWPGGMIVVPALGWRVDGTLDATGSGVFSQRSVSHNQSAASFAAADTTVEFTPEDIGLPTDQPYQVQIGMRIAGGSISGGETIGVRMSPKPDADDPAGAGTGTDEGYGRAVFSPSGIESHTYFGIFRFIYSAGVGTHGYGHIFDPGETITFKAYRTGGSGTVHIDNIYFFPVGWQPDAPANDDYTASTLYLDGGEPDGQGPTASSESGYADAGGAAGSTTVDTQVRDGLLDPSLTVSAYGLSSLFEAMDAPTNNVRDWDIYHPRHLYAVARVRADADGDFDYQDDYESIAAGFIAVAEDTRIVAQAPLWSNSFGFVYLGLVNPRSAMDLQLYMYLADTTYPSGNGQDPTNFDGCQVESLVAISSIYDWLHYADGGRAYLP